MKDFVRLPHYKATAEEKAEQQQIMRRGNRVLITYFERVAAKKEAKYSREQFRKDLWAALKLDKTNVRVHGICIPQADMNLILAVHQIEWDILCTCSGMLERFTKQWLNFKHGTGMQADDIYNTAVLGALNAVYGFTREGICFSTFVHTAIYNKLQNEFNASKMMCPWTQENRKLFGLYEETRQKFGMEMSFDEIVLKLKLSKKNIRDLRAMLTSVVVMSCDIRRKDEHDHFDSPLDVRAVCEADADQALEAKLILEESKSKMTMWEGAVLQAYLEGGTGWASQVAEEHINPATGTNYTRRTPQDTLRKVMQRLQETYLRDAA